MGKRRLFRKAALERLSSPERLDEMMQVTSPMGWLALVALGITITAAIIWSVMGTITIKVHGNGILMRGKEVLAVTSDSTGRVVEILIAPGDNVKEGQAVARINQPDLELRLRDTREELEELIRQDQDRRLAQAAIVAQLKRQRNELSLRVDQLEQALAKGLIVPNQVLQAKSEVTAIDERLAQTELTDASRGNRLSEVRRQLRQAETKLETSAEITSPYPGRVLELTASMGDLVAAGSRIVTLESFDEPIEAVIYVPAGDGKKVHPGMEVLISPSTVRCEEHGFIIGKVSDVSDYPMTPEGLLRVLRNQSLVQELTGASAPIEVAADLLQDPTTASGFEWSSSAGPPNRVFSGTLCEASVVVEKRKPISYVLPIFKQTLGISG